MSAPEGNEGFWRRLWRIPQSRWALGIPLGALIAAGVGAVGIIVFVGAVEMSST